MARLLSFLLWTAVFLLIVLAADQLLVRVPASHPAHAAVATFYRDLRSRLLDLVTRKPGEPVTPVAKPAKPVGLGEKTPPDSVAAVIARRQAKPQSVAPPAAAKPAAAVKPAAPPAEPASIEELLTRHRPDKEVAPAKAKPVPVEPVRRYLYADEQGGLHFAGTLAEVPEQYRAKARLVGE